MDGSVLTLGRGCSLETNDKFYLGHTFFDSFGTLGTSGAWICKPGVEKQRVEKIILLVHFIFYINLRETDRHRFVVPLFYAFLGGFLYVL